MEINKLLVVILVDLLKKNRKVESRGVFRCRTIKVLSRVCESSL